MKHERFTNHKIGDVIVKVYAPLHRSFDLDFAIITELSKEFGSYNFLATAIGQEIEVGVASAASDSLLADMKIFVRGYLSGKQVQSELDAEKQAEIDAGEDW